MDYLRQFACALEAEKRMAFEARPASAAVVSHPTSGEATWLGLKRAVNDLLSRATPDHDVVMFVADVAVLEAEFLSPDSFIFRGVNRDGNWTHIVAHNAQVMARIIDRPMQGSHRVVTRFRSSAPCPTS